MKGTERVAMEELQIRRETAADFMTVERIIRDAFWNLNVPGCEEHYLAHTMREHEDFISELDLVAEWKGQIVGQVMYAKSRLTDEAGQEKQVLTFGPVSVVPEMQRQGVGKQLLEASFQRAVEMRYEAIVIFGHPGNYISRGFKSCKKYNVCLPGDIFPTAMLVKELKQDVLDGRRWYYEESSAYALDSAKAQEYDRLFEPKEKKYQASQEEFYIYSHSTIG